jgi:hypothetical protein
VSALSAGLGAAGPAALEEMGTAVERLRWTTRQDFTRDIRRLCWTLAEGALGPACRELAAKTSLDDWLAACRAREPDRRLTWPAEDAQVAGLSIRCIGRFASDPESAFDFAGEFFWDDADPDLRLRRLVDELVVPLPGLLRGLLIAAPKPAARRRGLLLLGDEGRVRRLVGQALYEFGFSADESSERPWTSPARFAEQLTAAESWTAVVVVGLADLAPSALCVSLSPSHAAVFDIGFLVGQLGPEAVIPIGGPGVESVSGLSALRPVAVHESLPWRNALASRLTEPVQADGGAVLAAANTMT